MYHIKKWLSEIKMGCPKCGKMMVYRGPIQADLMGDIFECKCGFRISANEDFTWATVEKDVEPFYTPIEEVTIA